jgi:hypothetical protein
LFLRLATVPHRRRGTCYPTQTKNKSQTLKVNVIHPNQLKHTYPPWSVSVLPMELACPGRFDTIVVPRKKKKWMYDANTWVETRYLLLPEERNTWNSFRPVIVIITHTPNTKSLKKLNQPHPQLVTLRSYKCIRIRSFFSSPRPFRRSTIPSGVDPVLTVSYIGRRILYISQRRTVQFLDLVTPIVIQRQSVSLTESTVWVRRIQYPWNREDGLKFRITFFSVMHSFKWENMRQVILRPTQFYCPETWRLLLIIAHYCPLLSIRERLAVFSLCSNFQDYTYHITMNITITIIHNIVLPPVQHMYFVYSLHVHCTGLVVRIPKCQCTNTDRLSRHLLSSSHKTKK